MDSWSPLDRAFATASPDGPSLHCCGQRRHRGARSGAKPATRRNSRPNLGQFHCRPSLAALRREAGPGSWSFVGAHATGVVLTPQHHRANTTRKRVRPSKKTNVLFALALDERGRSDGVRAFSLHPGTIVDTNFKRTFPTASRAVGMVDEHGRAVRSAKA